ncbi:hypothetical protein TRVL_09205 [Trypanosoma vivax]|nr:hypothetical protein TRVL_09205 [Trypanosoma vivax]
MLKGIEINCEPPHRQLVAWRSVCAEAVSRAKFPERDFAPPFYGKVKARARSCGPLRRYVAAIVLVVCHCAFALFYNQLFINLLSYLFSIATYTSTGPATVQRKFNETPEQFVHNATCTRPTL